MSAAQTKNEAVSSSRSDDLSPWRDNPSRKSAIARLVELGITFAVASSIAPAVGVCSRCQGYRDARTSTAECTNVFCSKTCEHDFVHDALASLTVEDCVRMQQRLETLLAGVRKPAV
jgi:hypothetical protein